MANFVDIYKKKLEENVLFHTKLEKIKYEEGKLFLTITPLSQRFLLLGDSVKVGYISMLLPGKVVGKGENLIINLFYSGEGKWGDRSKPRVPVQKDLNFTVLIKIDGIYRAFEPMDISEVGLSLITFDDSVLPMMIGKSLEFKITGREELSGVSGTLRLVGIMEDKNVIKLSCEMDLDDADTTKVRLYVIKTIEKLFSI